MASFSKSRSPSKKEAAPVVAAVVYLDLDGRDDSWSDCDLDDLNDWDDDCIPEDVEETTMPSRAKSLKKQKKSVVQV